MVALGPDLGRQRQQNGVEVQRIRRAWGRVTFGDHSRLRQ